MYKVPNENLIVALIVGQHLPAVTPAVVDGLSVLDRLERIGKNTPRGIQALVWLWAPVTPVH